MNYEPPAWLHQGRVFVAQDGSHEASVTEVVKGSGENDTLVLLQRVSDGMPLPDTTLPRLRALYAIPGRHGWIYSPRDQFQRRAYEWARDTFGTNNVTTKERARRLFEEVVELCQAENLDPDTLSDVMRHVYAKAPGDIAQELGGVGVTLLAYAEAAGLSADEQERWEFTRVLSKNPAYYRERHNKKAAAGVAEFVPEDT